MAYVTARKQALVILAGAGLGGTQTALTQALDANGTFGPAPVPGIGGFGSVGGLIDVVSGVTTLGLGLAGAFGKGPAKNSDSAQEFLVAHGASALAGRTVAVVMRTPAVTVPGAMARRAGARPAAGAPPAAYVGGVAPPGGFPTGFSQARFT